MKNCYLFMNRSSQYLFSTTSLLHLFLNILFSSLSLPLASYSSLSFFDHHAVYTDSATTKSTPVLQNASFTKVLLLSSPFWTYQFIYSSSLSYTFSYTLSDYFTFLLHLLILSIIYSHYYFQCESKKIAIITSPLQKC